MGICRFVQPAVVRLALSNGDYVDVKQELNAGEQRRVFAQMVKTMPAGQRAELDPELVGKTKLVEYIVAWSFVGVDGKPEPVSAAAIDALDTDTYNELVDALDKHEAAGEVARAARKKGPDGAMQSPAISPSPSAVAGVSSGSVN